MHNQRTSDLGQPSHLQNGETGAQSKGLTYLRPQRVHDRTNQKLRVPASQARLCSQSPFLSSSGSGVRAAGVK